MASPDAPLAPPPSSNDSGSLSHRVATSLDSLIPTPARPDASRDPGATHPALSVPSPLWGGAANAATAQGWGAADLVPAPTTYLRSDPPPRPLPTRGRGAPAARTTPTLGIAISGGSDSTALLLLAHVWAASRNASLQAATVDHGLRPEAAAEAQQVAALCASLAIPHTTLRWEPPRNGMGGHISQAAARAARHRLLARWAAANAIPTLALGHTADDRIETFLIRTRAGSGWYGLAAPLPSAPSPAWPEGANLRLVRPLLAARRQTLRDHMTAAGQPWLDDPTNTYERHERIRARTLAARLGPEAAGRILAITARLARLRAAVMAEARAALAGTDLQPSEARIPRGLLDSLPEEPRRRLLEALVLAAGHAPAPPRTGLLAADRTLTLAGAWLRPGRDYLVITPAPPRRGASRPPAPDWRRAATLLADPCAELLVP